MSYCEKPTSHVILSPILSIYPVISPQAARSAARPKLFSKILPCAAIDSAHFARYHFTHVFPSFLNFHAALTLASQNRHINHNPLYDSTLGNHKESH